MAISSGDTADVVAAENASQIRLYSKRDIALVRGQGMHLWDAEGQRYLDMMSNFGVAVLGHAHPAVTAAVETQARMLLSCHQSFYNDARARFLAALTAILPPGLQRISLANSGTEANEAALKYARVATGRHRVVAMKRGYHGRTLGALSVTGEPRYRAPFEPLLEGSQWVRFGDLEAVRAALPEAAAVILEPVQGESGVHVAAPAYLRGLREACDQAGALLIFDEVQSAFRTGRTWAAQHSGVTPDLMTLSKPLANGLPIGVTVTTDAVAARIPAGSHGSTFAGNPLVCAAGVATLEVLGAPGFNERVARLGDLFLDRLRTLAHPQIREVRGQGLMAAVELKRTASGVLREMQRQGVLAIPAGSTTVRFLPPLIAEEQHIEEAVLALRDSL